MRVIVDIVHPADVLFFLHPIRIMRERGDKVLVLSREKDVAIALLEENGIDHRPVSRKGAGLSGLACELIHRDLRVFREARAFRPHVMVGLGGVAIAHVGRLLRIPSVSFYYADTAHLQTAITWPFISHLYVPEQYRGGTPQGRTTRFNGVKELSYFHPDNFVANREIAIANGLDPRRDNFFVRVVRWNANHDVGKAGWSDDDLRSLVSWLGERGKVHLSSERPLPEDLAPCRFSGVARDVHHVLAHCSLYIGESATMAHEAAFLGVPAIYDGHDHPGTTQSLAEAGLVLALHQPPIADLLRRCADILGTQRKQLETCRTAYLEGKPNLAHYVVEAMDRHRLPD